MKARMIEISYLVLNHLRLLHVISFLYHSKQLVNLKVRLLMAMVLFSNDNLI